LIVCNESTRSLVNIVIDGGSYWLLFS
jgi:hypothetical protein